MHVLGNQNFKYTIAWHLRHLFPQFKKIGARQYKCLPISNTSSRRAMLLTLLNRLVDSDFNNYHITIRTILKHESGICRCLLFPYLRNTLFRSIYHHMLSASYRRRVETCLTHCWHSYRFETISKPYMICSLLSFSIHEIICKTINRCVIYI